MSSRAVYEAVVQEVCELDRAELSDRLAHFSGDIPLDFSPDFLACCDTDRLRHLLVAALWRCRMKAHAAA